MNGMADDGARARRQLDRLISYQGRAKVREILGVDEDTLTSLLDGSLDWPADARERFDRAWGLMVMLGAPEEEPDEVDEAAAAESGVPESGVPESGVPESGVPESGVPESGVAVEDLAPVSGGGENPAGGAEQAVVDAKPAAAAGGGMAHRRRTEAAAAADERVQDLLWCARYLVITLHLRPRGIPRHQRLSAWAVLLRLEIELIRHFEFPLPRLWERRVRWNADFRRRQITLREDRLRDVERKEQQLYWRRLGDWLLGRDEDPNDLMLQEILDDARTRGLPDSLMLVSAEPDWNQLDRMVPPGR